MTTEDAATNIRRSFRFADWTTHRSFAGLLAQGRPVRLTSGPGLRSRQFRRDHGTTGTIHASGPA